MQASKISIIHALENVEKVNYNADEKNTTTLLKCNEHAFKSEGVDFKEYLLLGLSVKLSLRALSINLDLIVFFHLNKNGHDPGNSYCNCLIRVQIINRTQENKRF